MAERLEVVVHRPSTEVELYVRRVTSWAEAQRELGYFPESWLFRGQSNADWELACNLDRTRGSTDPIHAERTLLQLFTQRAHLFMSGAREPETDLEWLALIQHHGGPTRLIDFTRAPMVAAFFALEEDGPFERSAVWAIDELACHRRAVKRLRTLNAEFSWLQEHHSIEGAIDDRIKTTPAQRFVAPVVPSRLNARMVLQHGIFVCLGDPGSDLFSNLTPAIVNEEPLRVVKIEFPRVERGRALAALRRLNIGRDSLFPGLDGLAQSLAHHLAPRIGSLEALDAIVDRPVGWPGAAAEPPRLPSAGA